MYFINKFNVLNYIVLLINVISDLGDNDNLTTIEATIMKVNYGGGFSINGANEIMSESLVINSYFYPSVIGSPIFYSKNIRDNNEPMYIIGMVTKRFDLSIKHNSNYVLALNNKYLYSITTSIISKWLDISTFYENIHSVSNNLIDSYIRNGFPKAWLGIDAMYYNYKVKFIYPELTNFPYIGGLIVKNIVLGFDTITYKFIYDALNLIKKGSIRLWSPLENSLLHKRLIDSGSPIVIKYITIMDLASDQLSNLYIGKYGNQLSYASYIYGQQFYDVETLDATKYTNLYKYIFSNIQKFYINTKNFMTLIFNYFIALYYFVL